MAKKTEDFLHLLSNRMSKADILAFAEGVGACNCDKLLPLIVEGDRELSANAAYVLLYARRGSQIWLSGQTEFIIDVVQSTPFEKTRRLLLSLLEKLPLV